MLTTIFFVFFINIYSSDTFISVLGLLSLLIIDGTFFYLENIFLLNLDGLSFQIIHLNS